MRQVLIVIFIFLFYVNSFCQTDSIKANYDDERYAAKGFKLSSKDYYQTAKKLYLGGQFVLTFESSDFYNYYITTHKSPGYRCDSIQEANLNLLLSHKFFFQRKIYKNGYQRSLNDFAAKCLEGKYPAKLYCFKNMKYYTEVNREQFYTSSSKGVGYYTKEGHRHILDRVYITWTNSF